MTERAAALPFDDVDLTLRQIDAGGLATAYVDVGRGAPVVLLHGSGAGVTVASNWWRTVDPLAAHMRVLAPELAGFGSTASTPGNRYSIAGWADHVVAFLDALGLDAVHLIGNSLGGWVGLELAARHPDRVRRMVLMGTGGAPATPGSILGQHQRYEPGAEQMRALLTDFVVADALITDSLVAHRYEMSRSPDAAARFRATSEARREARHREPLRQDALAAIPQRILLVHGREDRIIPASWSWQLHSWLPNSDLHVFSHCGHWSQIERADDFNQLALSHLERP